MQANYNSDYCKQLLISKNIKTKENKKIINSVCGSSKPLITGADKVNYQSCNTISK